MMISGLEATADAIQTFEGWKPGTSSYVNRNPGNLRGGTKGIPVDGRGFDVFPDFPSGYAALLRELQAKFSGHNAHGITPASTVLELFEIYAPTSDGNPTNAYAAFVADWVGKALGKPITVNSPLQDIWQSPAPNNGETVQDAAAGEG